jgi:hypothetical protein
MACERLEEMLQIDLGRLLRFIFRLSVNMEDSSQYSYRGTLRRVGCSITEKGKPYQELVQLSREFLESCLSNKNSEAEIYQFLTELAAEKRVSIEEIQSKISILAVIMDDLNKCVAKLDDSFLSNGTKRRIQKKGLKEQLLVITQCNRVTEKVINDFWDYLPQAIQKKFRKLQLSLLSVEAKEPFEKLQAKLDYYGRLSGIAQVKYQFYTSVLDLQSCTREKNLDDWLCQEEENDWYEPEIMKSFLDSLVEDVLSDQSKLIPYTEEMSAKARDLIADVYIDD